MTLRRHIDTTTRDYTMVRGSPRRDATIASSVVLALLTRRGSSAVLPWLGSRLHLIRKLGPSAPARAVAFAKEALRHLVVNGSLQGLTVVSAVDGTERLELVVTYKDTSSRPRSLTFTRTIGAESWRWAAAA